MKGLCTLLLLPCLFFAIHDAPAQSADILRLRSALQHWQVVDTLAADTAYVGTLNHLARAWYGNNADSAFFYSRKALAYSDRTGFEGGKAESWRVIGNAYEMIGDYQGMLNCYHRSKSIAEHIGNKALVAKVNVNIALFYKQMGEYEEAWKQMDNYNPIYEHIDDSMQLAYVYSHLSDISLYRHEYDKALEFARRAETVSTALKDSPAIASFTNNIGKIYSAEGEAVQALSSYRLSMDYYVRTHDRLGISETSILLARNLLMLHNYAGALRYARQGLAMAQELQRKKEIKEAGKILAGIYEAQGDTRTALRYFKLYKDFSDSLFNEQTRKQTFALEARYEYERREDSLRQAAVKKDIIRQHLDRTHTNQIVIAVLLILFLVIVAFVLLNSRKAIRKANAQLRAKNQEIELQKEAMEHQAVQLLLNNQQKDKLFSIIAHDLRGPLNSLKGLMDFLKENKLPEAEIRNMMAELSRNVNYSSELVGNLLFWASSQLNGIVMTPVELSMRQMVNELLAAFVKQAGEKNIVLYNGIEEDVVCYADKDMTQVTLRNLISNAIKFCRSGDSITISSSRNKEGFAEICVSDTGIGIGKDVLEKIRRRESITTYGTAREKGTGLGMLLCREFVEANHGQFHIESEQGRGSWFYFTMPVAASSSSIKV